jgi:3-dehydroquinate dehydratase
MQTDKFSRLKFPAIITSLSDSTANDTICTINNALYDGTDAFMIHLQKLNEEEINEDSLINIFSHLHGRPIYTMNYRRDNSQKSDDERIAQQLLAIRCGAQMIDMMGDMFCPTKMQLTTDNEAISKQQRIIEQVHSMDAEVLLSSHTWVYMTTEELYNHTKALEKRGPDFIKIAMTVNSKEEMLDAMKSTYLISRELSVPFLHICMGPHGRLHRTIGPLLGSCFALSVQKYTVNGLKDKTLLRAQKAVFDNIVL